MTKPHSQPSPSVGLITATIDAATGKIVEVRSVDDAGASSELTKGHRAKLSKQTGGATLEDLFEEAFEAGIACVLGEGAESAEEADESEEDAELRRQILLPMIESSGVRRLLRQEVLGRAIVGTLIQTAADQSSGKAPSRSASASKAHQSRLQVD